MTPRSFWTIVIKIMGIYIAYQTFTTIWQSLNVTVTYAVLGSAVNGSSNYPGAEIAQVGAILLFIIYILMVYACIFKTEWLINKLSLDIGYPEELFEFNISRITIFKIIITIVGWIFLADIIPVLIKECIIYFQKVSKYEEITHQHTRTTMNIIIDLIKIIIGVLMVTCGSAIANLLDGKSKDNIEPLS